VSGRRAPNGTALARRRHGARRWPVALTGTAGVGKSSVARRLSRRWAVVEVAELARRLGCARRRTSGLEVDLPRLRRAVARLPPEATPQLLVGHLAHLLPVREAIVLRCRPRELRRRLDRSRRGRPTDRTANVVSEAVDLVLVEALELGLRVYEVDTTGRTVGSVAREVADRLRRGGRPRHGTVDWLSDRRLTAHLLDAAP
jgi:adenylate kinase